MEGKTILVVDDDPDIISAITAILADAGAEVVTVADGDAAIEQAREVDPDLIILDAMLPKRSGFLVLEALRKGKKKGERPHIIMITGNQGRRHQAWAESLGVDAYMNKPFRMDRLVGEANRLLAS
ncbi:MAG: response regulator [Phycisphaerales bacterium]|nr:MAG: response regulator [Phycisphaerales bacterium]